MLDTFLARASASFAHWWYAGPILAVVAYAWLVGLVVALLQLYRARRRRSAPNPLERVLLFPIDTSASIALRTWRAVRFPFRGWLLSLVPNFVETLGWLLIDTYRRIRHRTLPRLYGVWIYVGIYGAGKTVSMVAELDRLKRLYGDRIQVFTNFGWEHEDGPIRGWRHFIEARYSDKNSVFAFDELSNTWDQNDFKNFPKEMIPVLTQNRKWGPGLRIMATTQRFSMAEVTWKRLAHFIIECRGVAGARWIFQEAFQGLENYLDGIDSPGQPKRDRAWRKHLIITDAIRSQYDTYYIARRLGETADEDLPELPDRQAEEAALVAQEVGARVAARAGAGPGLPGAPRRAGLRSVK